ncbi:N-methyl-L-tryptophan oxidase [Larsenimonas rhizosphaerae]|uniref:N-methyl-L-tryptophan oxidase n=1 Tax=Larsenimonas rhizosphaerae TaxID=2944682 RepID=UPI0020339732|nr:N-methyl-L-tryptophan oxidase [Larsenimonas rhizosphaerae]
MTQTQHASRHLIIGGGSMGLAAADALVRAGAESIQVLDAHCPPHSHGAHHGETRLIRLAYGEGSGYVGLAEQAWAGWQQLEQETGASLLLPCGVINMGPSDVPFIQQVQASAREYGLPLTVLAGDTARRRFPGWQINTDWTAAVEHRAGVLWVERIVAAWRARIERARHVTLTTNASVIALEPLQGGGATAVCADGRRFTAERVLLAAGQHIEPLLTPLGIHVPLTRVRKTFAWFDADARYQPDCFPGFSLTDPERGIYYGFPDLNGAGFKMGRHDQGQTVQPGVPLAPFGGHDEDMAELQQVIDRYLPGVGALRHGAVCQYIRTPDEHFLIDEVMPGLVMAGGFSGHGFKFACALGDTLADWLHTGTRAGSLAGFTLSRAACQPRAGRE